MSTSFVSFLKKKTIPEDVCVLCVLIFKIQIFNAFDNVFDILAVEPLLKIKSSWNRRYSKIYMFVYCANNARFLL